MASAILEVMVMDVAGGTHMLRAKGQRVKFPGYLSLSPERQESEFLPPVKEDDPLDLLNLQTEQHFTQPPARYRKPRSSKRWNRTASAARPPTRPPSAPSSTGAMSSWKRKSSIPPGWGWW